MGLQNSQKIISSKIPFFKISEISKNENDKKNSELEICVKMFLVINGELFYYYLMREADGLHYFRLQRTFEKISKNIVFFQKITKNHFLFGEENGNFGVYFIDLESSYASASTFKTESIESI